ncbi:hypothetical protein ACFE04_024696 [Oxalis oulophora]
METLSLFAVFFFTFLAIYLFAYFTIFRNWGPNHRPDASSSLMSLAHGTPAVILSLYAILIPKTPLTLTSQNSEPQNRVLEFSMAYFLVDLLHYIVFKPSDFLYILHHLATLYVLLTCRCMVGHGGLAVLGLLILAEVTSPCQNIWSLAGYRKSEVVAAAKLHESLSPPFFVFYSVCRGILGPAFVYKMALFYFSGGEVDGLIPKWAWISWMFVIVTAILVSILWILNNWSLWYNRHMKTCKMQEKLR